MDIRDINDFNNYYLDDDDWEFKAATPIEASDEEIKASVDTFIDGNYPGEFTQEEIIGICEAVRDRLASPYRDIDEGDLLTVVMNVTAEAKIRKERAAEVGYEYDDDEMPQLTPYEDDEDFGESLEATVDQDLTDNRQPAMDIGEKEMAKPVSYADMIKGRFGLKESKSKTNSISKDGDYIFRVEMLEPGAHYRMSFLDSKGNVLEQKDENCMDDVLINIAEFERMCYDKYCECEGCEFNPMSNDIVFDWQVKTFWGE